MTRNTVGRAPYRIKPIPHFEKGIFQGHTEILIPCSTHGHIRSMLIAGLYLKGLYSLFTCSRIRGQDIQVGKICATAKDMGKGHRIAAIGDLLLVCYAAQHSPGISTGDRTIAVSCHSGYGEGSGRVIHSKDAHILIRLCRCDTVIHHYITTKVIHRQRKLYALWDQTAYMTFSIRIHPGAEIVGMYLCLRIRHRVTVLAPKLRGEIYKVGGNIVIPIRKMTHLSGVMITLPDTRPLLYPSARREKYHIGMDEGAPDSAREE